MRSLAQGLQNHGGKRQLMLHKSAYIYIYIHIHTYTEIYAGGLLQNMPFCVCHSFQGTLLKLQPIGKPAHDSPAKASRVSRRASPRTSPWAREYRWRRCGRSGRAGAAPPGLQSHRKRSKAIESEPAENRSKTSSVSLRNQKTEKRLFLCTFLRFHLINVRFGTY